MLSTLLHTSALRSDLHVLEDGPEIELDIL